MSDSLPVLNFRLTPKVSTPSPRSSPGTNIHSSRSNISLPPPPAVSVLVGDGVGEWRWEKGGVRGFRRVCDNVCDDYHCCCSPCDYCLWWPTARQPLPPPTPHSVLLQWRWQDLRGCVDRMFWEGMLIWCDERLIRRFVWLCLLDQIMEKSERVCGVCHYLHRVLKLAAREQGPGEQALSHPPPHYGCKSVEQWWKMGQYQFIRCVI